MKFGRIAYRVVPWTVLAVALCVGFAASSATGQSTIPNAVVAGGGGTVSAGNVNLHFTLGEPAAGPMTAGSTTMISGFQATFVTPTGGGGAETPCSIFCDGFESTN
jgi:hypothetical protein